MMLPRWLRALVNRSGATAASPPVIPFVDGWPLPEALRLDRAPGAPPVRYRPADSTPSSRIQVFAYPFDDRRILEVLALDSFPTPEAGTAADGKYCEIESPGDTVEYVSCRALIRGIWRLEPEAGRGFTRLRWVALDRFGYLDQAQSLYRSFEAELGPAMAAMGLARVLSNRHPARALALVENARYQGFAGAAMSACHARMLFACGRPHDGVAMAVEALLAPADPQWLPADDEYTWGYLHGAAFRSADDPALAGVVRPAIASLLDSARTARRAMACAALAEAARDDAEATRCADAALRLGPQEDEAVAEAHAVRARCRQRAAILSVLEQSPLSLDVRRTRVGSEWKLDGSSSTPGRAVWRHANDDELTLATAGTFDVALDEIGSVRAFGRRFAECHGAGLVEADVVQTPSGPAIQFIYKTLAIPAFTYFAVQINPTSKGSFVWTVTARESGITGTREALVTAKLMSDGKLTPETYVKQWARDPYDPWYRGVERSRLRYLSDDRAYDALLGQHPLTRVRSVLRDLATLERIDAAAAFSLE